MSELHDRVRFEDLELKQLPEARCVGRVVLAWPDGEDLVGTAECVDTPPGRLRCAAEATARALELAVDDKVALEVLAVKAIETFDTVIVIVSLASRIEDRAQRVVGSCLIKEQPTRGAALAVLSATNRALTIYSH